jgi:enoyl-CoA hydratase/carnithine racemase
VAYDELPDVVEVEVDGPVRIVTLNRPDAMNAFSDELHAAFPRVWAAIEHDREARAVVLTGAGRAFSAGGDIEDFTLFRVDFAARRQTLRDARRLVDEMLNVPLPVVAAVNGPAVGLGCTLMTLCDVVFISEDTYIADPHVSVALVAGDGGAVTWPLMTSILTAKRYLLSGDRIPASDAVKLGLATQAVAADRVVEEAVAFAHRLAGQPPQAVQDTKLLLNQPLREAAARLMGHGLAAESQSHDTPEYAAVPEKFKGRA